MANPHAFDGKVRRKKTKQPGKQPEESAGRAALPDGFPAQFPFEQDMNHQVVTVQTQHPCAYIVGEELDQGSRARQEDAARCSSEAVYLEKGFMAVVSDGMGGMGDGDRFSEIAVREMVRHFETCPPMEDLCQELRECFKKAHDAAQPLVQEGSQGGATVVAVLVRNGRCAFLSVGDSSICLLRGGGLIKLNRVQNYGVMLDESVAFGYLSQEYATDSAQRKTITDYLGSESAIHCDVCPAPFELVKGDRIALMTDGVTGTLSQSELERLIGEGSCIEAAQNVISAVKQKNKPRQDNSSIMLIGYEDNPFLK